MMDFDALLALQLQNELDDDIELLPALQQNSTKHQCSPSKAPPTKHPRPQRSIVDSSWEVVDPTPDIYNMFRQFDDYYFWGKLECCEVRWSQKMTLCAGVCVYEGRGGLCSIRLSQPLLKLRPRRDLVQTLLHEMIHAYLFVTHNNKDHNAHGPEFHKHMYRINKEAGTKITVYHSFHNEVASYRQHWWRCNGPCQKRSPFFGMVKRSMNRAPSQHDTWWAEHRRTCGGHFTKVKEPEGYDKAKLKKEADKKKYGDITPFLGKGHVLVQNSSSKTKEKQIHNKENSGTNYKKSPLKKKDTASIRDFFHKRQDSTENEHKKTQKNIHSLSDSFNGKCNKKAGAVTGKVTGSNINSLGNSESLKVPGTKLRGNAGTLVVTQPKYKTVTPTKNGSSPSEDVTPFTGSGHVLGGSSVNRLLERFDKPTKHQEVPLKNEAMDVDFIDLESEIVDSRLDSSVEIIDSKQNESSIETIDKVVCPCCNGIFTERDINSHLDDCLGQSESGSCPGCGQSFPLNALNDHLDSCLDDDEPSASVSLYPCPVCGDCVREDEMNSHLDTCVF